MDGDTVDPLLLHQARVLQGLDDNGLDPLGDIVHSPLGVQLLLPVPANSLPLAARRQRVVTLAESICCPKPKLIFRIPKVLNILTTKQVCLSDVKL